MVYTTIQQSVLKKQAHSPNNYMQQYNKPHGKNKQIPPKITSIRVQ